MILIPKEILSVLNRLESHGFEAFVVGGCVRDSLLGITPADWDVCTAATPDRVQEIFSDIPVFLTGLKHGTVTLLWDHQPIEVTTFRCDGAYMDHRRPATVTYTKQVKEDLMRRDFTVNAMAYSPKHGLLDFFDGQKHLNEKRLTCVGDAKIRFQEDALRILRALRFAATYGFTIAEETATAIHNQKDTLWDISAERIYAELKKMLVAPFIDSVLEDFADVFSCLFPDTFLSHKISHLPSHLSIRFAGLLQQCKEKHARDLFHRLKADKKTIQEVSALLQCLFVPLPSSLQEMRYLVRDFGMETVAGYLALKNQSDSPYYQEILEKNLCCTLQNLAIDGKDLQETVHLSGAEIGKALQKGLEAVLTEKVPNEKDALLNFLFS